MSKGSSPKDLSHSDIYDHLYDTVEHNSSNCKQIHPQTLGSQINASYQQDPAGGGEASPFL